VKRTLKNLHRQKIVQKKTIRNKETTMQQSMNNTDKQSDPNWTGKSQLERGVSELKNLSGSDISAVAGDISTKVRDISGDLFRDSISLVKRYPVSSAIGMAAVGFLAGFYSSRSKH
jgi:hypothetical protein